MVYLSYDIYCEKIPKPIPWVLRLVPAWLLSFFTSSLMTLIFIFDYSILNMMASLLFLWTHQAYTCLRGSGSASAQGTPPPGVCRSNSFTLLRFLFKEGPLPLFNLNSLLPFPLDLIFIFLIPLIILWNTLQFTYYVWLFQLKSRNSTRNLSSLIAFQVTETVPNT